MGLDGTATPEGRQGKSQVSGGDNGMKTQVQYKAGRGGDGGASVQDRGDPVGGYHLDVCTEGGSRSGGSPGKGQVRQRALGRR